MTTAELTLLAFTAFNTIGLVAYFPQMTAILRDPNGASAISIRDLVLVVGVLPVRSDHAIVNVGDRWLVVVNAIDMTCCASVIALTWWKRSIHPRTTLPPHSSRNTPARLVRRCHRHGLSFALY